MKTYIAVGKNARYDKSGIGADKKPAGAVPTLDYAGEGSTRIVEM